MRKSHRMFSSVSRVALGAAIAAIAGGTDDRQAWAGSCSATNATVNECDAGGVTVTPNTGSSSLTVDGVTTVGIFYTPGDSATGAYSQSLWVTGGTVVNNPGGYSGFSGGNGITLKTALADQDVGVVVDSGVSITAVAGYGGGIWARSETTGDISIVNSATVRVTGVNGSGVPTVGAADGVTGTANLGSVLVTNHGTVTSNGRGLYADGNHGSVTLNADYDVTAVNAPAAPVTITNTGAVSATWEAARAIAYNGTAKIDNSGTVSSSVKSALVAWSDWGDAVIVNSGSVTAADRNALTAQSSAHGVVVITNSGTVTADKAAVTGSATRGYSGLRGYVSYSGDVTLTNTASGTITSNYDAAMAAHSPSGSVVVDNEGALTGLSGVFVGAGGGTGTIDTINDTTATTNTIVGSATVINGGTITATERGVLMDASTTRFTNSGTVAAGGTGVVAAGGTGSIINTGTITGTEYAVYNSGGALSISNAGTLRGDIRAETGALTISGASGSNWGVLAGSTGGIGVITSNSANSITLASGNILLNDNVVFTSGGTLINNANTRLSSALNVQGSYVQSPTAGLTIDVYSATNHGRLTVTGAADLRNGTATLATRSGFGLAAGQSYTIVRASSLSASGFTAVTPGFPNTVTTTGDQLTVSIDSWTTKLSLGGAGLGAALDTLAVTSSTIRDALTRLASLPSGQQTEAVAHLGTSQLTPQVDVSGSTVIPTTGAVQRRLTLARATGDTGMAAGDEAAVVDGVWGQFLVASGLRDTTSGADGFTSGSFGLMFGWDRHVTEDLSLGVAASWLNTRAKGKAASAYNTTDVNGWQLTSYGTWRPGAGPGFLEGLAAVGLNAYDQKRGMPYLGLTAHAEYLGTQYQAKLGGGYDLTFGALTVTPAASLRYARALNAAYTEKRAGDFDLRVRSQTFDSLESELGVGMSGDFKTTPGDLKMDAKASWAHSFTDAPIRTSAVMGGVSFATATDRPSRDGLRLSTGLDLKMGNGVTSRLEYDNETRSDFVSHTCMFHVRGEF